jgi:hypothetical protein
VIGACPLYPLKADIDRSNDHVSSGPEAESCSEKLNFAGFDLLLLSSPPLLRCIRKHP